MGIFDKAKEAVENVKDLAGEHSDTVKNLAEEHGDKLPGGLGDKVADIADKIPDGDTTSDSDATPDAE